MKRKLEKMPYAQCEIIMLPNGVELLKSYDTIVAEFNTITKWFAVYGLYSQTTRKHISAYCQEIGTDYQTAKHICNNNYKYNVGTGEVIKIEED